MEITKAKIISLSSLLGALLVIWQFGGEVTKHVVTKNDIEDLANEMRLQNIEIKISLNEVRMRQYEEMQALEPQQQRRYQALIDANKRLEEKRVEIVGH